MTHQLTRGIMQSYSQVATGNRSYCCIRRMPAHCLQASQGGLVRMICPACSKSAIDRCFDELVDGHAGSLSCLVPCCSKLLMLTRTSTADWPVALPWFAWCWQVPTPSKAVYGNDTERGADSKLLIAVTEVCAADVVSILFWPGSLPMSTFPDVASWI